MPTNGTTYIKAGMKGMARRKKVIKEQDKDTKRKVNKNFDVTKNQLVKL